MGNKLLKLFALMLLFCAAGLTFAQERGEIVVINDWDQTVDVTLVMERHDEMIRKTWSIRAGQRAHLAREGGHRIRVRGSDRIKIKVDSRPVVIGDVGRFRDGEWHVRVREVYQTQRGRDENRRRDSQRDDAQPNN